MRKALMALMLVVPTAVLVAGQTRGGRTAQRLTDEQQIINLSRQFADANVVNSASVVTRVSGTRPKRVVVVAEDGEANPFRMERVEVDIGGDRAELTSRLVFSGQRSSGEVYERSDSWTVRLVRRGGQWQVVGARLGAVGK